MRVDLDDMTLIQMSAIRRSNESLSRLVGRLVRAERLRHRRIGESFLSARQEDAIDALRRDFVVEHGDPLCSGGGGLAPSDSAPSRRFGAKGDRARP